MPHRRTIPPALALLLGVATAAPSAAQTTVTSAERAAIVNAVRASSTAREYRLGTSRFTSVSVQRSGRWVHFTGTPTSASGAESTHCSTSEFGGDAQVDALLYQRGTRWEVLESGTCATDVWYLNWGDQYGADAGRVVGVSNLRPKPFPVQARVESSSDGFVSIRSAPSIRTGERVSRMPSGAQPIVLRCMAEPEVIYGEGGRWCRVRLGRVEGWSHSAYLSW